MLDTCKPQLSRTVMYLTFTSTLKWASTAHATCLPCCPNLPQTNQPTLHAEIIISIEAYRGVLTTYARRKMASSLNSITSMQTTIFY